MKGRTVGTSKQTRKREWTERRARKRRNPHRPMDLGARVTAEHGAPRGHSAPEGVASKIGSVTRVKRQSDRGGMLEVSGSWAAASSVIQSSSRAGIVRYYAVFHRGRRYIAPCVGPRAPCRYQQLKPGRPLLETMIRRPDLSWCASQIPGDGVCAGAAMPWQGRVWTPRVERPRRCSAAPAAIRRRGSSPWNLRPWSQ